MDYNSLKGREMWELRPTNDRIFFFAIEDGVFIMLHHFTKKTQKTPPREIEQAKRNMEDFLISEADRIPTAVLRFR